MAHPNRQSGSVAGSLIATCIVFAVCCSSPASASLSALHASGTNIVNSAGNIVELRGVNLGGWLITENWMCPTDSSGLYPDDYSIISELDSRFGVAEEQSLIATY